MPKRRENRPAGFPPSEVLDEADRRKFLHFFDRASAVGRRDFAIALCLSELALRANEVASLTPNDVGRLRWPCAR